MKPNLTLIITICCLAFSHIPSASAQTGDDYVTGITDIDNLGGEWNNLPLLNPVSGVTFLIPLSYEDIPAQSIGAPALPPGTIFRSIDFGSPSSDPTIGPDGSSPVAPEPSTISLAALSAIILVLWHRRRAALQKI